MRRPIDPHFDLDQALGRMRQLFEASNDVDPFRRFDPPAYIAAALGGLPADIVDHPEQLTSGTVLHRRWSDGQTVTFDQWIDVFTDRIRQLVDDGHDGHFLVGALLDYLEVWYVQLANAARAADREHMYRTAEDPAALASYRDRLIERDPSAADRSLEEIADGLRRLADKLPPIEVDEEAERLVWLDRYRSDAARLFGS